MKLVMLGPPGAGKGTQADILSHKLGIPSISTGEILRDAVKRETPVGLRARALIDAGSLVSDEVIISIITERLSMPDCRAGYIFDGAPRTIAQAAALDERGVGIDAVVLIEISDARIEERLTGRRFCPDCGTAYHTESIPPKKEGVCDACGAALVMRKDDDPETVKNRLKTYHYETEPLKAYYSRQGKLKTVEGAAEISETAAAILKALGI